MAATSSPCWPGPERRRVCTSMSSPPARTLPALPRSRPVLIETELLRAGRSASQIRARMEQDGTACVEAALTASSLSGDTAPYWDGGLPERSESSYEDCPRSIPNLPSGARVAIMEQVEVRLEPDSRGFDCRAPQRPRRAARVARPPRSRGVRPECPALRGGRFPAGHVRHRVFRLGADSGADGLRTGAAGSWTGPRAATCAAH